MDQLLTRLDSQDESVSVAVVGGGAGGVEIAFAIHQRLNCSPGKLSDLASETYQWK